MVEQIFLPFLYFLEIFRMVEKPFFVYLFPTFSQW
jgi:hypothetical protein